MFEDFDIKNATVLAADIQADNSVIHIIDESDLDKLINLWRALPTLPTIA